MIAKEEDEYMRNRIFGALASILIAGAVTFSGTAQAATAPGRRGLDVSSYQHPGGVIINWRRVARNGYSFVFIKATEGTYYVNPYYAQDLRGAEGNGLIVGAYAFAVPSRSPGWAQADFLIRHMGRTTLAPVLDIEWNPYAGNECYNMRPWRMVAWITSFEGAIRRHLHEYATINTPSSWWNRCTRRSHQFANVPLWDENNRYSTPSRPVLPAGWHTWSYWQKSITGRIPGIHAQVDIDVRRMS